VAKNISRNRKDGPPLGGLKVLDLTRALAGPYCTMMLADLGADVIKVEPPGRGDETREWGPPFVSGESAYFMSVNRNKRSIVINLKEKEGLEVLRTLARKADVLVENFRPGTASKLGVDYGSIRKLNPKVVYCSVSGFGQTGPYSDRAGYDLVIFAESGQMSITGEQGRPPVKAGVPVSDIGGGMFAAFAIASALLRRAATGEGEHIDVSLFEGQISWLTYQAGNYFATGKNPARLGSAHPTIAPYQAFKGKDEYFVVAVGNDELWTKFCAAIGREDLEMDSRFRTNPERVKNRLDLEKILGRVFRDGPAEEWVGKLVKAGVPSGMINPLDRVFSSPQAKARDIVVEVVHPKAGKIRQLNMPYRFGSHRFRVKMPPPLLGEHTREVLAEAGYSRSKIDELLASEVVNQAA
jgi:crotonobetainyl-CoA:carnitine CoA-transferase CaiB-like acyl-CoA transferase